MKDKIIKFFEDVVKEMKKVTWPTKPELMESTKVVIIACLILASFTYVIDMIINLVLKGIF
ncbi:MAG: preprotein translocase subunit SecE [Bacteroidetes bacterium]|nr:preprotein translocase subunit SecE [Bacteroidota bacterium]MCH8033199.1 preprotein translocase subunit SecE [Bacteroidota bacterium]